MFLTGELNDFIENVRKVHEQIIDHINPDRLSAVGWAEDQQTQAEETVRSFTDWIVSHREEITALQLFYGQPFQRRALTYQMIQDLANRIMQEKPTLAPLRVWQAYEQLERVNGQPKNQLIALVSLIRRVTGLDGELTTYDRTVDKNFQAWVFNKQAGNAPKFTEEQMQWLRMIKDFIASSIHLEQEDFDLVPFNQYGGLGKFYQVFGANYQAIIEELNEQLAA